MLQCYFSYTKSTFIFYHTTRREGEGEKVKKNPPLEHREERGDVRLIQRKGDRKHQNLNVILQMMPAITPDSDLLNTYCVQGVVILCD